MSPAVTYREQDPFAFFWPFLCRIPFFGSSPSLIPAVPACLFLLRFLNRSCQLTTNNHSIAQLPQQSSLPYHLPHLFYHTTPNLDCPNIAQVNGPPKSGNHLVLWMDVRLTNTKSLSNPPTRRRVAGTGICAMRAPLFFLKPLLSLLALRPCTRRSNFSL
jgi:hypothetical protein